MKLSQMVMPELFIPPEWDREFAQIAVDSRDVQPGDVFIARRGLKSHGEEHIAAAIEQGAVAVLAEGELGFRCEQSPHFPAVPVFFSSDIAACLTVWLHRRYASVADMKLVAVTGTNGKSSVTQYMAQLAGFCAVPCGVLGTLGNGVWPDLQTSRNTTADLSVILRNLQSMQERGVNTAALEVSSHGLTQQRVAGLNFCVAVLTNLTQDHLDYHGSMADYFAAKRQLFVGHDIQAALINIDDDYGRRLAADTAINTDVMTYGASEQASVRYSAVKMQARGMQAWLDTPWGSGLLVLPLIGEFNLANATAAIAALALQGFDFVQLLQAAQKLEPVAGRMELYVKDNAPLAVVDFAHTPDALLNVLQALKPWNKKITAVFGCGGDRDRSKRPLMAQVAAAHADIVWLTDDNPRSEDPQQIFADALNTENTSDFYCEHDRSRAIAQALDMTAADGIVVIAGKGHENYQEVQGVKLPYSDAAVLSQLGYRKAGQLLSGDEHAE